MMMMMMMMMISPLLPISFLDGSVPAGQWGRHQQAQCIWSDSSLLRLQVTAITPPPLQLMTLHCCYLLAESSFVLEGKG